MRYMNPDSPFVHRDLKEAIKGFSLDVYPDEKHKEITDRIISAVRLNMADALEEYILHAARLRNFLG